MHYTEIPTGAKIVRFARLTDTAKTFARREVIEAQEAALRADIKATAAAILKQGINKRVNNRYRIKKLVNAVNLIRRMKADTPHTDHMITQNLCEFTENGELIRYTFNA